MNLNASRPRRVTSCPQDSGQEASGHGDPAGPSLVPLASITPRGPTQDTGMKQLGDPSRVPISIRERL